MPRTFTFIFLSCDTIQDVTGSHHTILYDEADVCDWSCCDIIWIISHCCDEAGTGWVSAFLEVTVSSGDFWPFSPIGTRTCTPHIRGFSRAISEW